MTPRPGHDMKNNRWRWRLLKYVLAFLGVVLLARLYVNNVKIRDAMGRMNVKMTMASLNNVKYVKTFSLSLQRF